MMASPLVGSTYRRPNEKKRMRRRRCLVETFMFHKIGIGKVNITMSLRIFPAEWIYHWYVGMQVALMSFIQYPEIG